MGSFGAVIRMVARRSLGHWKLLVALVSGVVLSAALMSSVFLYSDAIRDLGLRHALDSRTPLALDVHVIVSGGKVQHEDYEARRKTVDALVTGYASDIMTGITHSGTSSGFYLTAPGEPVPNTDDRPRSLFAFQEGLMDHAKLVEGVMPPEPSPGVPGQPLEVQVLMGKDAAESLGVKVGQAFDVHWPIRETAPIRVVVAGLVQPNDMGEPFWAGHGDRFRPNTPSWPTYAFFMDEAALVKSAGGFLPDMDISVETLGAVDAKRIVSGNSDAVEGRLNALDLALKQQVPFSRVETEIPAVIKNYREKLFFTRLPLFALMIQVVGIVLFYVAMVGSMVVDRQTGEIALLKSRGASNRQVLGVFAIEGLGIGILATVAGPIIAIAAISVLGLTPPFHDLSGGALLHVPLSGGAIALAGLGAFLAFLALIWPAYRACRYSITQYKQEISRPPVQPAFFRYHLDVVVAAAGAFAFYQLRQNDSFATKDLFGDLSFDPIRLATPSLLILLVAMVFLRLFPLVLGVVSWASKPLPGPTVSFGLLRMVRSPVQHSRLILLLILTTAVGVFAAGFRATLEQGYRDRADYRAGAAVRIQDIRLPNPTPIGPFNDLIAKVTGSRDFTAAARQNAFASLDRFQSESLNVLGVEPDAFARIADWRGDFAGDSLAGLLSRLPRKPQELAQTPAIPGNAKFIGVWANLPIGPNAASLGIRLRNADGITWDYRLTPAGTAVANAWTFYYADLSKPVTSRPAELALSERRIDTIFVRLTSQQPLIPETDTALFDDLQTTTEAAASPAWNGKGFVSPTVADSFDDMTAYELVTGVSTLGNPGQITRGTATNGPTGTVARLTFTRGPGSTNVVGFRRQTDQRPVPVVVDQQFLDVAKKKVGDEQLVFVNNQYVNMTIVGAYDLFPTYDPQGKQHLFIADLAALQASASRTPTGDTIFPNEAWLNDNPGGLTKQSLLDKGVNAQEVADRDAIFAAQSADPLVAASWQGILFLCFAAVLLLSGLGFITHSGLSAQARSMEFAILRTMGMSGRQIVGVVSFEQVFVIVAGLAAGTILGFPLSRLMIDSMGITESGVAPVPPLVSRIGWDAVVTVYSLLGMLVGATIVALFLLYSRIGVSKTLRMGEL